MKIEGYLNKGFKQITTDYHLYIYAFSNSDARKICIEGYLKIKRR